MLFSTHILGMQHGFLPGCDVRIWSRAGLSIVSFPHGEQSYHKGQICPFSLFLLMPQVNDIVTLPETYSTIPPSPARGIPLTPISFPPRFLHSHPSPCIFFSPTVSAQGLLSPKETVSLLQAHESPWAMM
ncbi:unnamed protein product [Rangifer tarandus platyrhynchus]|uniref:Uncharacterized protein n=1 Tax=Rangifer tarandus platyrhynchus TaxID=3082113 RepID=A0AC59YF23_RANTA